MTAGVVAAAASAVLTHYHLRGPDPDFASYRTSFDDGDSGWRQFEALAQPYRTSGGHAHAMKSLILRISDSDPEVYFIPSRVDRLHWDFAHDVLRFRASARSRQTLDLATYVRRDRDQLATELTWYPTLHIPEGEHHGQIDGPVVLQFAAADLATVAEIQAAVEITSARMPMAETVVYAPSTRVQERYALAAADALESAGIEWLTGGELGSSASFQSMNTGTVLGRLREVTPAQLAAGAVDPHDIVLLAELPLDMPIAAGTITAEPQTTLAHVNIVARNRGTPNMVLARWKTDARVAPLIGRTVRFEVTEDDFRLTAVTEAELEAFWRDRAHPVALLPTPDLTVEVIADLDSLGFRDAAAYGAKAANLADLHRVMPEVAPGGLAVPFAAFDAHLRSWSVATEDCDAARTVCTGESDAVACKAARDVCRSVAKPEGVKLDDYIQTVLEKPEVNANVALRAAVLNGIRWFIEDSTLEPVFAEQLKAATLQKFGDADVRLRSSTNSEDIVGFSGAGLYDSVSGEASGKNAVTRKIQHVWASAWSRRAVEERRAWNVPDGSVHMAVLVNQAFPDEHCNGVLVSRNLLDPQSPGFYVNVQHGEEPVTNPTGDSVPQILVLSKVHGVWRTREAQASSLNDSPCLRVDEEAQLGEAARRAHEHFAALYDEDPGATAFEMEFKIHDAQRRLYIKQIRPYRAR